MSKDINNNSPYAQFYVDYGQNVKYDYWRYYNYISWDGDKTISIDADFINHVSDNISCPIHKDIIFFSTDSYEWQGPSDYGCNEYKDIFSCVKCNFQYEVHYSSYGG